MTSSRDESISTNPSSTSSSSTGPGSDPAKRRTTRTGEMVVSIVSTVVFDIVLAIGIFQLATSQGASDTAAYLLSTIGPVLGLLVEFIRHRRVDVVGLVILVLIGISLVISLVGSTDPKVLLLKDSVFTGGIGLVILASLLPVFPRPLMFYLGRKFATDGTDAGVAWWESLWQYEGFRHSQRVITAVWGAGFLLEAIVKTVWVLTLPFDVAYTLNQIGPLVITVALMGWTFLYAARVRKAGEQRAAARAAEQSGQPDGI